MSERTYTTIDKTAWGEGPWQDEPDKVQFVDEATGLPCLVKRNHAGALCGYVGVPPGHPLFGIDYGEVEVDVHGGELTYAAACEVDGDEATAICHVPEPGEPDGVWWFGFDCAHACDYVPEYAAKGFEIFDGTYRTIEYVRRECERLAAQLATTGSEARA